MTGLSSETVTAIVAESMKYHNYAPATIKRSVSCVTRFGRYLDIKGPKAGLPVDFRDVKEADYYDFLEYAERTSGKVMKKNSLRCIGTHIRMIFSILEEEDKILRDPFSGIESVKTVRTIRDKILTGREMEELLESLDESGPEGFRDRAIFELLYGMGIRSMELVNLELCDFLTDEKMLFIKNGKGKKDRVLPLGMVCFEYISRYIKTVRPKLANRRNRSERIFLDNRGRGFTKNTLSGIFRKIKKEKGFPFKDRISPHVIRHSFATHLVNAGADIREVQLLLGHNSIKSTQIYLNIATAHLKETYETYHPLENELYFDPYSKESHIFNWRK